MTSVPRARVATSYEAGAPCQQCRSDVCDGQRIVRCPSCGSLHHEGCWRQHGGCAAYECAPARRSDAGAAAAALHITARELEEAVPLPSRGPAAGPAATPWVPIAQGAPSRGGRNRLAAAAFVTAVVGIPLFGLVTGLVAIVLGSMALGMRDPARRGTGWAVGAVFLGLADMIGWIAFIAVAMDRPAPRLALRDLQPDPAVLERLPPTIERALRANVLIEVWGGWLQGTNIGSGVVLRIRDGEALIVTNRHVVAAAGAPAEAKAQRNKDMPGSIDVRMLGQGTQSAKVIWTAPDEIDLALIVAPVHGTGVRAARWTEHPEPSVGDEVFAVGNPHGLGWTHTRGDISQLRTQHRGGRELRIIQTSTAINAGNSGGGLYDEDGTLIGITTWTNDKRISEGLSFAISFEVLLRLAPARLQLDRPQHDSSQP